MGVTAIQWTATPRADGTMSPGYSFNPWTGCTKVSAGCQFCYAEPIANRFHGGTWGPQGTRKIADDKYWQQPASWNRAAAKAGGRRKVFCASMADVFEDRPELEETRKRLFRLILETPSLDWLLLTKRPENAARMMGPEGVGLYACDDHPVPMPQPNIWVGTSCENQATADERIPLLLKTPAAVRFLSLEPLLNPINFMRVLIEQKLAMPPPESWHRSAFQRPPTLDWIIVGGESGPHARPCDLAWIRSIVKQCRDAAGARCFVKQLGSRPFSIIDHIAHRNCAIPRPNGSYRFLTDSHGGDPSEWPEDLRVREFPR